MEKFNFSFKTLTIFIILSFTQFSFATVQQSQAHKEIDKLIKDAWDKIAASNVPITETGQIQAIKDYRFLEKEDGGRIVSCKHLFSNSNWCGILTIQITDELSANFLNEIMYPGYKEISLATPKFHYHNCRQN